MNNINFFFRFLCVFSIRSLSLSLSLSLLTKNNAAISSNQHSSQNLFELTEINLFGEKLLNVYLTLFISYTINFSTTRFHPNPSGFAKKLREIPGRTHLIDGPDLCGILLASEALSIDSFFAGSTFWNNYKYNYKYKYKCNYKYNYFLEVMTFWNNSKYNLRMRSLGTLVLFL